MHDLATVRAALLAKPGAEESFPFDAVTLVAKVAGKMFALVSTTESPVPLSLNSWGQQVTGWSSINIYEGVYLERTAQPLQSLRQQDEQAPSGQ